MTTDVRPEPPGRVAFCAPGNEMLAAVTCSVFGEDIAEVRAHPCLEADDLYVVDLYALEIRRLGRICDGGRPLWPERRKGGEGNARPAPRP